MYKSGWVTKPNHKKAFKLLGPVMNWIGMDLRELHNIIAQSGSSRSAIRFCGKCTEFFCFVFYRFCWLTVNNKKGSKGCHATAIFIAFRPNHYWNWHLGEVFMLEHLLIPIMEWERDLPVKQTRILKGGRMSPSMQLEGRHPFVIIKKMLLEFGLTSLILNGFLWPIFLSIGKMMLVAANFKQT